MKIKTIIDRVQALFAQGITTDKTPLSDRHIYNKLLTVRNFLIHRQAKSKNKIGEDNYITLPCVELIRVPVADCPCFVDLGCDIWRTKHPLPKPLMGGNKHLIDYVMTIDNKEKIEEATRQEDIYSKGNKYTGNKNKFIYENRHLYFKSVHTPKVVKVRMLPEDPVEALLYPSCCEGIACTPCSYIGDFDFPIDAQLIEPMIALAKEELITEFKAGVAGKAPQEQEQPQG